MSVTGVSNNNGGTTPTTTNPNNQLGENAFLQLLVAQMKNQNPMSPTKSTQFIGEMAQFQTLSSILTLEKEISQLQATQSASLIGKNVTYQDPTTLQTASGTVTAVQFGTGTSGPSLTIGGANIPMSSVQTIG